MCKCTPGIKTPFCGRGDCQWPERLIKGGKYYDKSFKQDVWYLYSNEKDTSLVAVQNTIGITYWQSSKDIIKSERVSDKGEIIDVVTASVRKDLLDRSTLGIKKYGTTLDRNNGDLRYWLNHAYEEALDHAQYLKRAIMEIDNGKQ